MLLSLLERDLSFEEAARFLCLLQFAPRLLVGAVGLEDFVIAGCTGIGGSSLGVVVLDLIGSNFLRNLCLNFTEFFFTS